MLIFYFALHFLLLHLFLFLFLFLPLLPTNPRRHTRLVGSSLQLFVQAGALLWVRLRAFLGVNFNESGTAFAYQHRFMCILGVPELPRFLMILYS